MRDAGMGMGSDPTDAQARPQGAGRTDRASCRCGVWWAGPRAAHCSICHRTFGGVSGFDTHRVAGHCVDPATKGYALVTRAGWSRWIEPPSAEDLARLRRVRAR